MRLLHIPIESLSRRSADLKCLGLNFSLDAAAAIVVDGRVVAAACQERFDRVKHSAAYPQDAIWACLHEAGLSIRDLDQVAVSWNPAHHLAVPNRLRETIYRDHREYLETIPARLIDAGGLRPEGATRLSIPSDDGSLDVVFYDHHLCHAAGAYTMSGFEEASFLTADGYGETRSTTWGTGDRGGLQTFGSVDFPHSLGAVYAAVTSFLGFRANNGEGKVMALAGLGDPATYRAQFDEILRETADGFEVDLSYFAYFLRSKTRYSDRFVRTFGPPRVRDGQLCAEHLDLAAALQAATERVLLHLARLAHEKTGMSRLCLAGGLALNAVAMGVLEHDGPFDEIFVLPPAHDGGGPLGAALLAHRDGGGSWPRLERYDDRLGPGYESDEIGNILADYGIRHHKLADVSDVAADLLARGKILGWMQRRMEYGPRALGGRSILADPRKKAMKDTLNAKVKYREAFRPFAPIVRETRMAEYFADARPSPYMNKVYQATDACLEKAPAVVHDDGSVRVQSVSAEDDDRLDATLAAFEARTGVPMLVNTSLNKRGQPICATLDDALACLFTSGLDALVVEDYLIEK